MEGGAGKAGARPGVKGSLTEAIDEVFREEEIGRAYVAERLAKYVASLDEGLETRLGLETAPHKLALSRQQEKELCRAIRVTRALRSAAAKDRLERGGGGRREDKLLDRERRGKEKRSDTSDLSASDSLATLSESQSATDSASMAVRAAVMRPGGEEAASAHKLRREARRKEKERGGVGAYQPLSFGQRVLWALAGSAVTAVAVVVHFQLIIPLYETLMITTA